MLKVTLDRNEVYISDRSRVYLRCKTKAILADIEMKWETINVLSTVTCPQRSVQKQALEVDICA